jgi:Ca2+-binding RTX toxin-like protein
MLRRETVYHVALQEGSMNVPLFDGIAKRKSYAAIVSLAVTAVAMAVASLFWWPSATDAALLRGAENPDILLGRDEDNVANPAIQPAGVAANQSLNNTDVLTGEGGNDILVGLLGSDVLVGGAGADITIGGPEGFVAPNSDVIFGDDGNDINIWAPGDGSDLFVGGNGVDTQVFGVIDRDAAGVPTGGGSAPGFAVVPTANVSGQGGFCTVERSGDPSYEFLIRFFVRATGALAVTIRTSGVERVLCTSQAGGQITFADLTAANPVFIIVTHDQVQQADPVLGAIIR